MEGRMKVMIAYDGSAHADAALDDLRRAGLPREAEALIVSVGDGLVSAYSPVAEDAGTELTSGRVISAVAVAKEQALRLLAEARGFASHARDRVLSYFPEWEGSSSPQPDGGALARGEGAQGRRDHGGGRRYVPRRKVRSGLNRPLKCINRTAHKAPARGATETGSRTPCSSERIPPPERG